MRALAPLSPAVETELKLLIDPTAVPALKRHPALARVAAAAPRSQQLENLYFDTPDRRLRRIGIVWRVRRIGPGWVQTVKADGKMVSGLHRRPEWESPVAAPQPDLAALLALPDAAALPAELAAIAPALREVFRTDFERTTWNVELAGGATAEVALDEGAVAAGRRKLPICELEIELATRLAGGDAAALFDFALELARDLPLRLGVVTKAERGFLLRGRGVLPAVKARPIVLAADCSLEQALVAIAGECMAQMLVNEAGVIDGGDADCLHQMRVGLRRLRTALRLFRRWIVLPQELKDGLAELSAALGPARDAEVLGGETLARLIADLPDDADLPRLQQAVAAGGARRLTAAVVRLTSAAHVRLMLEFGAWLHGRRWRAGLAAERCAALDAPAERVAAAVLARCRKRLAAAVVDTAGAASAQERHALRIAAKRLRYATEFFAPWLERTRARRSLSRLAALQDLLGQLNDVAVADAALRELARRRPTLAEVAAFARGWLAADAREAAARWPAALAACLATKQPRRAKH